MLRGVGRGRHELGDRAVAGLVLQGEKEGGLSDPSGLREQSGGRPGAATVRRRTAVCRAKAAATARGLCARMAASFLGSDQVDPERAGRPALLIVRVVSAPIPAELQPDDQHVRDAADRVGAIGVAEGATRPDDQLRRPVRAFGVADRPFRGR